MKKEQILDYDWEFGKEKIRLKVGNYMYGNRLYIGMLFLSSDGWEPFSDLTVNLPHVQVKANEAFIDHNSSKAKLDFIVRHKLGKVSDETASSGYCTFQKVAFDLERLRELDPDGVSRYMEQHPGLQKISKARKRTGMER